MGGSDPTFGGFQPPKISWDRSRTPRTARCRVLPACIQRSNRTLMRNANNSEQRKERISMAVLKAQIKQPKTTPIQLRLDDEARANLTNYAEFLDSSPSYVVTEALKLLYRTDKEFQAWLPGQHKSNHQPSGKGETVSLQLNNKHIPRHG